MKFDSDTIENVMARMDAVKAGSKFGFLTNYFRQEMVGNVILSAGTERSVVFVNDEHDFFRLFFFTTDLPDLSRVLAALEFPTTDEPNVIRRATSLAIETNHHLFDALYHAVALEHEDALLVTADDRYYRKAERYGRIAALRDWEAVL